MKISKAKLRQIIKEEFGAVGRNEDFPTEIARALVADGTIMGTEDERTRLTAIFNKAKELGGDVPVFPDEYTDFMGAALSSIKGFLELEEGKVSGHRSEVTYSKGKRGKSKKPEKKAYNKADRAQAKRDLK